jgi:nitrate/nitrite transport system substrate-binding protein
MTRPMTPHRNPFDPYNADRPLLLKCRCGADHAPADHAAAASSEAFSRDFIEATLVKALLPSEPLRRRFLQAVGATAARAAIGSLLPMGALEAMAQDKGPLEKRDLKIGFIAITCPHR